MIEIKNLITVIITLILSILLAFVSFTGGTSEAVSYTHLRAHETPEHLVCRLLLEKKKKIK